MSTICIVSSRQQAHFGSVIPSRYSARAGWYYHAPKLGLWTSTLCRRCTFNTECYLRDVTGSKTDSYKRGNKLLGPKGAFVIRQIGFAMFLMIGRSPNNVECFDEPMTRTLSCYKQQNSYTSDNHLERQGLPSITQSFHDPAISFGPNICEYCSWLKKTPCLQ